MRLCKRIAAEAKTSWDIKAQLIREEQFLWDNAILSLTYAGNQKYNALDFLGTARECCAFRYEGQPALLGILATWNWYQLKPQLRKEGWTILDFAPLFDIRERLRLDKASHLLADGIQSFYVVNSKGGVCSWISTAKSANEEESRSWEMIPKAYQLGSSILIGRDLALIVNGHGEVLLFNRDLALKWNLTGWHRLTGCPISDALATHVSPDVTRRIVEVVSRSSELRQGALLVVSADGNKLLKRASSGLAGRFQEDYLFNLRDVCAETVCRIASIDGAMIIESDGTVRNAGVILEVPEEFTSTGEGARTAAAAFASTMGVAIKVSHDGPISIFENGTETRRAG